MKLKSELTSKILKMVLWILVGLTALDLIATVIFAVNLDFFMKSIYSVSGFVSITISVLYYLSAIVYLVWIFRVHLDLKQLNYDYPLAPGAALFRMMIPFYNLYGIPSTYLTMGRYLNEATGLKNNGRWIGRLAIPLIVCFIASGYLNRMITKTDEPSGSQWVITIAVKLILYVLFLALSILVSNGIKKLQARNPDPDSWPIVTAGPGVQEPL